MTLRASVSSPAAWRLTLALVGSFVVAATAIAQTSTPTPTTTRTMPATAAPASAAPATARPTAATSTANGQAASPDQLFIFWDKDRNKMLSLDEFTNGWESAREQNIIGRLESQFRSADKDRSGLIEAPEFANLLLIKRAGSGAPPMSAFDANKDQKIDFKEYLDLVPAMLKRLAPPKK